MTSNRFRAASGKPKRGKSEKNHSKSRRKKDIRVLPDKPKSKQRRETKSHPEQPNVFPVRFDLTVLSVVLRDRFESAAGETLEFGVTYTLRGFKGVITLFHEVVPNDTYLVTVELDSALEYIYKQPALHVEQSIRVVAREVLVKEILKQVHANF